jgi:hypothetical protein
MRRLKKSTGVLSMHQGECAIIRAAWKPVWNSARLNHTDTERQAASDFVDELDGRSLIAGGSLDLLPL